MNKISIVGLGSRSPLGATWNEVQSAYGSMSHRLKLSSEFNNQWCGPLPPSIETEIKELRSSKRAYTDLDKSVLLAILSARDAIKALDTEGGNWGFNLGSSRGATRSFEHYHQAFVEQGKKGLSSRTSPLTTAGNLSSWVAQDLKLSGIQMEHSVTCSTAAHAILNGVAWLQAGMCDRFLAGGTEASLTPFTLAQIQAMRLYTKNAELEYPCRGVDYDNEHNTMVLGEGSAIFALERFSNQKRLAQISSWGIASEQIKHNTAIDPEGKGFQTAMQAALHLGRLAPSDIDAIIMHAPGTYKGDQAEFEAIKRVFEGSLPLMTGNKWKIGHTFGASAGLSIEMGIHMLKQKKFIKTPFCKGHYPNKIQRVMVNAMGFGGNAISFILEA